MPLRRGFLKAHLRQEALNKRDSIHPHDREIKDKLIRQRLLSLSGFHRAKTVLLYASFRSEVETISHIEAALSLGKRVVLPVVDRRNKRLNLYEIKAVNELIPGYMGIPEPSVLEGRAVNIKEIEFIAVPCAGIDERGNRLGYGAGYYDTLLKDVGADVEVAALAYEEQVLKEIPHESHDIRVRKIITDKRVIDCRG